MDRRRHQTHAADAEAAQDLRPGTDDPVVLAARGRVAAGDGGRLREGVDLVEERLAGARLADPKFCLFSLRLFEHLASTSNSISSYRGKGLERNRILMR